MLLYAEMRKSMNKNRNKKIVMIFIAVMLLLPMHTLADNISAEAVTVSEE